ncbi:hypothetical protein CEV33_1232 [Brucella grignonensis]|uniref:Uncharacterized protein n=1 Tax=Brucella grignonensis TaxID=94627 RepID=A0A256FCB4_9HYPH|nr:hypothetical protein CEV33_1232 [Brucella grignonensis]
MLSKKYWDTFTIDRFKCVWQFLANSLFKVIQDIRKLFPR